MLEVKFSCIRHQKKKEKRKRLQPWHKIKDILFGMLGNINDAANISIETNVEVIKMHMCYLQ